MEFGGNYKKEEEEEKRTRGYCFRSEKGGRRRERGRGGLLYLEQSHPPSRLANGCLARELFSRARKVGGKVGGSRGFVALSTSF